MALNETRDTIIKEVRLRLGSTMIDVELEIEDINLAIDKALEKYRQRSDHSTMESFMPLTLKTEQAEYTLPDEIIEVKKVYRRSIGITSGGDGFNFDPFESFYINQFLAYTGTQGGIATFDAFAQHREMLGRFFGAELNFTFNSYTKKLIIQRKMRADDDVFLHVYNYRPEEQLFNDTYSKPWIKDYSLSMSKLMLAEARGKYNSIAGPQGGTTLNADMLRTDALAELEKLELDLKNFTEGGGGFGFVIG